MSILRVGSLLGFVVAVGLCVSSAQAQIGGGTVVATNGFEGGETLAITTTGGSVTNDVGAALFPANSTIRSGEFSWQVNSAAASFDSDFVAIGGVGASNNQVIVRAASIAGTTGNGIDSTDFIKITVAVDGAAFGVTPDIQLNGTLNNKYAFTATNELQTFAGVAISTSSPTGDGDDNYANFGVDVPNSATSVAVRVEVLNNSASEYWCLDDIEVQSLVPGFTEPSSPDTNVFFAIASATVNDEVGTYDVVVFKSLELGSVTGQVALSGDATLGADYTIDTTNFTMNGSTTSATFTITVTDDADTSSETVILTLANVVNGTPVAPTVFTLTITPPSPLYISEVSDPGDNANARFVELYNSGGSPIDLAAGTYVMSRQVNGGSYQESSLTGTVAAGSTYVIAHDLTAFSAAYPSADFNQSGGSAVDGNGDDAYFLFVGGGNGVGTIVDIYGVVDLDGTGEAWQYENDRAVRTDTVTSASAAWNAAEWVIPGSADVVDMTPGVHPDGDPIIATNVFFFMAADSVSEDVGTYVVTVFKSLALGNVSGQVEIDGDATEGGGADYTIDTTNFTMNGATTSSTFTITVNDDVDTEASETVVLTLANIVDGTLAAPAVFVLTISANDAIPEGIVDFRFTAAPELQATTKDANITVSNMTLNTGSNIEVNQTTGGYFPDEPYVAESGGWNVDNQAAAKAFEFTIEPASGYEVSITGISFSVYATGAGPSGIGYDINGGGATFATDMPADTIQHFTNAVTGVDDVTTPISVLIQAWTNGSRVTSGTGVLRMDDVVIFGTVVLTGGGGDTTLDEYDILGISEAGGTFTVTIDVSSNGVPYNLIYTTNILTDPAPAGTGTADSQNGDGGSITLDDTTPADEFRLYWIDTN